MSVTLPAIRFHEFGALEGDGRELVGDFIPIPSVGLLVGEKSLGKTFNSIELAVCLATGRPYAGIHEISNSDGRSRADRSDIGATLFILSEGNIGFQKRLDAARLNLSVIERRKLSQNWGSENLPIAYLPAPRMAAEQEFNALLETINDWQGGILSQRPNSTLELIVVDTIAGAFVGFDENRTSEAQEIMARLKRLSDATGSVVMGVTHPSKNGSKREAKGSVNLGGSADFILSITKSRGRGNFREVYRTKVRDAPDRMRLARYRLTTVESTHDRTSQIVNFQPIETGEIDTSASAPSATSYLALTLEAFETAELMHSTTADGHDTPALSRNMVRDFATALAQKSYSSNTDSIQRSVNRVLNKLVKEGRMTQTKEVGEDGKSTLLISLKQP